MPQQHHIFSTADGTNSDTQEICTILKNHHTNHIPTSKAIYQAVPAIQYNADMESIHVILANLHNELPQEDHALKAAINSWIRQNHLTNQENGQNTFQI